MSAFEKDQHFQKFTDSLKALLESQDNKYEHSYQKQQVESLVGFEKSFIEELGKVPECKTVLDSFVEYILNGRRNILSARPFFRERNEVFRAHIADILAERRSEELLKYNLNCCFVKWTIDNHNLDPESEPMKLAAKALAQREQIIQQNMPLAISRAKLFWQKTQKSHLTYMDLVQISGEGLINAVDKFCLPYTPVFRAVIIGRITGNLIDAYSRPMLHFYPADKRKIYHANKAVRHSGSVKDLVQRVNEKLPEELQTNEAELQMLMNAASHLSADHEMSRYGEDAGLPFVQNMPADESCRPDIQIEEADMNRKLLKAVRSLPIVARKVLAMKGFFIEGMFDDDLDQ